MKIIAFSGSNSSSSINQQFVHAIVTKIDFSEVEVIDLRDYPAPIYGIDLEQEKGFPESIKKLNEKFNEADAFILASPEHNGSMPAFLKNSLDWISRISENKIFKGKPSLFFSTSQGPRGGASALQHMIDIMPYRGAEVLGGHAVGNFSEKVQNGMIVNEDDENKINELLNRLKNALS